MPAAAWSLTAAPQPFGLRAAAPIHSDPARPKRAVLLRTKWASRAELTCGLQTRGQCDVSACEWAGSESCILGWVQNWVRFMQCNPEVIEIVVSWVQLSPAVRESMMTLLGTAAAKR